MRRVTEVLTPPVRSLRAVPGARIPVRPMRLPPEPASLGPAVCQPVETVRAIPMHQRQAPRGELCRQPIQGTPDETPVRESPRSRAQYPQQAAHSSPHTLIGFRAASSKLRRNAVSLNTNNFPAGTSPLP